MLGDQISTEARAAWNIGKEMALWLWAPDINLFKDPRWGRGQEVRIKLFKEGPRGPPGSLGLMLP
jgi:beta-glucosidase-like glycosyl hydrolase